MPLPLDITLERRSFIQSNGDIDDYIALILENTSPEHVDIPENCTLTFPLTDCKSEARTVWDSATNDTIQEWIATTEYGTYIIRAALNGYVPANEVRIIGLHAIRRKRAEVLSSEATFNDPIGYLSMGPLDPQRVEVRATVIFPKTDPCRALSAEAALQKTSRTATWRFTPTEDSPEQIRANLRLSDLPAAPRRLDDAIAEAHQILALDSIGRPPNTTQLRCDITEALKADPELRGKTLQPLTEINSANQTDRHRLLSDLIDTLHNIRTELSRTHINIHAADDDVTGMAQEVFHNINTEIQNHAVRTKPPEELWDSLLNLLDFASTHRQASFPELNADAKEEKFQDELEKFVRARTRNKGVIREPEAGNGRIDLLLRNTPVELKVQDLKGRPYETLEMHTQQAAEYASRRNQSVAALLVLDTHNYPQGANHQPHLRDQVRVFAVTSRQGAVPPKQGIDGASTTIVVAIALTAYSPEPSSLRKTVPRRRRTNQS
ncbi:hypothetical protein NR798_30570 [Archangium gephyra]|uniref:hypothetical protein n=1 Tax=Archangium gephyra TaxID=48 RepID=UPI0035D51DA8